ncbi:hypothetical protein GCM10009540_26070 [Streptomyces turgidiscabies]
MERFGDSRRNGPHTRGVGLALFGQARIEAELVMRWPDGNDVHGSTVRSDGLAAPALFGPLALHVTRTACAPHRTLRPCSHRPRAVFARAPFMRAAPVASSVLRLPMP